jgi:hypothetical protein
VFPREVSILLKISRCAPMEPSRRGGQQRPGSRPAQTGPGLRGGRKKLGSKVCLCRLQSLTVHCVQLVHIHTFLLELTPPRAPSRRTALLPPQ